MTDAPKADAPDTDAVVQRQRRLQQQQDRRDAADSGTQGGGDGKEEKKAAVQAGAREHPADLPAQHLAKPGNEHEMQLKPQFLAPDYKGSGKLDGMAAIVTGGDSGIGRAVAVLFAREGLRISAVW